MADAAPEKMQSDHVETTQDMSPKRADGDSKIPENRQVEFSPAEAKRVRRKIDPRVVPIVTVLYLFSFLDRGYAVANNLIGVKSTTNRAQECRKRKSPRDGRRPKVDRQSL